MGSDGGRRPYPGNIDDAHIRRLLLDRLDEIALAHGVSHGAQWSVTMPGQDGLSRIKGIRIFEVPISYNGRTYEEGKKIGLKDAFRALYVLGKHGVVGRLLP